MKLFKRLSATTKNEYSSYPKILLDGLYGSSNQLQQALCHETVVIVAGGVGIVSFISLLSLLQTELRKLYDNGDVEFSMRDCHLVKTRRVIVHWICRDKGLIQHVVYNYLLENVTDSSETRKIEVCIHDTSNTELGTTITLEEHHAQNTLVDENKKESIMRDSSDSDNWNEDDVVASGKAFQLQSTSFRASIISRINFLMILWCGAWLIQFFYDNVQERHVVSTRCFIALALMACAVMGSIMEILLGRIISMCCQRKYKELNMIVHDDGIVASDKLGHNNINIANINHDKLFHTMDSFTASTTTLSETADLESQQSPQQLYIDQRKGRPDMDHILGEIFDSSQNVGIFLCGPTSLHENVRLAVHGKARCCSYPMTPPKAVIYEEVFEL